MQQFSIGAIRDRLMRPHGQSLTIVDAMPSLDRPVSQACTASQFEESSYRHWCEQIREEPRRHRKQWEFCYIAQVLATQGMLAPGRRGLGFGVGTEPLVALFAAAGAKVLATDLEPVAAQLAGWTTTEQHADCRDALNRRAICRPEVFDRNVNFRFVDMNAIPADIGQFDFVWSSCAFEHLGSIRQGCDFIVNSAALLRPGGVAVHTTEFNCSSDRDTLDNAGTVLFRRRDFVQMSQALRQLGLEIVLNFDLGDEPLDQHVDVPPYSGDKHLKLRIDQWVTTSFGLAMRRA